MQRYRLSIVTVLRLAQAVLPNAGWVERAEVVGGQLVGRPAEVPCRPGDGGDVRLDRPGGVVAAGEFVDQPAFDAYMEDERRVALADWRDRAVERTQVLRVELM